MKNFLLVIIFLPFCLHAQVMEINWTSGFRKELIVTCNAEDLFCESLCQASSMCVVPEGACRDCIGTSLKMNYLISEIGNTILSTGIVAQEKTVLDIITNKNFVTLTAQDVYNVIDAARSVRAFKKFENLCPEESVNQILFLSVDPKTREIKKPEFIYCDYFDRTEIFEVTSSVIVDIQMSPVRALD